MDDLSSCGKRLRYARVYRGMSQVQLSLATGFPQTQISAWELDKTLPSRRTCVDLEKALQVAWYWIRHGTDAPPVTVDPRNRQYLASGKSASHADAGASNAAASKNRRFMLR